MNNKIPLNSLVFAVFIGASIPIFFFGKTFTGILVGIAVLSLLVGSEPRRLFSYTGTIFRTTIGWLGVLCFLTWLPNVFQSLEPLKSFSTITRSFALVFLAYLIWYGLHENASLRRICQRSLIITLSITLVFALFSKLMHPGFYWVIHYEPWQTTPMLTELKPLAALTPLATPLLLSVAHDETGCWRWAAYVVATGLLIIVFVANSRSSVAGLLGCAAFALMALVCCRQRKKTLIAIASVITGSIAVLVWLKFTRNFNADVGEWYFPVWLIDFERQAIWQFAIELFTQSPWVGLGVNTINLVPGAEAIIPATNDTHFMPSHPHNWALEILAETGIIGFVTFTALVGMILFKFVVLYRRIGDSVLLSTIAICGGYFISGLFNFSFWAAWWQLSFLVFCAMSLARTKSTNSATP
jgi:O-antigen ligase